MADSMKAGGVALPWDFYEPVPYAAHVVVALYMMVVTFCAFVGNGLVLLVFCRYRTLRTAGNMLIVNLSVSDMLMAITGFPLLIVSSFQGKWNFPKWVCDVYGGTATMFGLCSINTLVFIAVDRCLAIVNLDRNKHLSYRQVYGALVIIWLYSAAWGFMPAFGWGRFILEGFGTTCTIDYISHAAPGSYLLLGMFVFDFLLPLVVIMVCYAWIFKAVATNRNSFRPVVYAVKGSRNQRQSATKRHRLLPRWLPTEYKVAKTILIVTVVFCISWAPYSIVLLVAQYGNVGLLSPTVAMLPALFAKTSTVFNPIIYSVYHPKIGSCIKRIVNTLLGYRCVCAVTNVYSGESSTMDTDTPSTLSSLPSFRRPCSKRMRCPSTDSNNQMNEAVLQKLIEKNGCIVKYKEGTVEVYESTNMNDVADKHGTEYRQEVIRSSSSSESDRPSPCMSDRQNEKQTNTAQATTNKNNNANTFVRQSTRRRTLKVPRNTNKQINKHTVIDEEKKSTCTIMTTDISPDLSDYYSSSEENNAIKKCHKNSDEMTIEMDDKFDFLSSMTSISTGSGSRDLPTSNDDVSNSGSFG